MTPAEGRSMTDHSGEFHPVDDVPEADEPQRPEWVLAENLLAAKQPAATEEQWMSLAAEVVRLRDYAFKAHELVEDATGRFVGDWMEKRIRKIYMGLNAQSRWEVGVAVLRLFGLDASHTEVTDLEGETVDQWNRLVSATASAAALALGNARWAVIEHRNADRLRVAIRRAERAILGSDTPSEADLRLHEALGPLWAAAVDPEPPEGTTAALAEQRRGDVLAVLTVYDEHVPPENRGPWRDRLHAWASRAELCGQPTPEADDSGRSEQS